jgi:hypothetical protein
MHPLGGGNLGRLPGFVLVLLLYSPGVWILPGVMESQVSFHAATFVSLVAHFAGFEDGVGSSTPSDSRLDYQ